MRIGKVPHVRRIFNLPAKKFDIRPVSLARADLIILMILRYPMRVLLGRRSETCKNATNQLLLLLFLLRLSRFLLPPVLKFYVCYTSPIMAGLVLAGAFEKLIALMIPWPPPVGGRRLRLDLLLDVGDSAYLKRFSRHKRGAARGVALVFPPNCESSRHK